MLGIVHKTILFVKIHFGTYSIHFKKNVNVPLSLEVLNLVVFI